MKYARLMRISPFSTVAAMFVSLFVLGTFSASAQVGTPPLPSGPPPGLELAPPCDASFELAGEAKVPCLGFTSFVDGTSMDDRAEIVRGAGAVLRFNYNLVNATAVLVPDEATLSALLADPNIVALIPDRPIHAIAKPKNPEEPWRREGEEGRCCGRPGGSFWGSGDRRGPGGVDRDG